MSSNERRIAPRKVCVIPLRFRILTNEFAAGTKRDSARPGAGINDFRSMRSMPIHLAVLEGEAVNLSERGIYFRSRESVSIGDPLEMYFTLPSEFTGRNAEEVRCSARVVHVERRADQEGLVGVGAAIERFEPLGTIRNWDN
jgi:PilZ domain